MAGKHLPPSAVYPSPLYFARVSLSCSASFELVSILLQPPEQLCTGPLMYVSVLTALLCLHCMATWDTLH